MFKLQLSGALGADAELRDVGSRKAINFRVAVNREYKNSDGEKVERTEWISAVIWKNSKQSLKVADYLKKGKKVILEGEPGVDAFINKDGEAAGILTLNVKDVEFLS